MSLHQFHPFASAGADASSFTPAQTLPRLLRLLGALHATVALAAVADAPAPLVVINEIHFDPADKRALEFVELHNPGTTDVRLEGWTLQKFSFPADSTLPAGQFVVIAQDPEAFAKEFGFSPFGPLPGKLSNNGEKLTLRDARKIVVDEVRYGVGFPWPTAAKGAGSSLERIAPGLPSSEPASWRSSGYPTVAPVVAGKRGQGSTPNY
jgi:hypothetical protein